MHRDDIYGRKKGKRKNNTHTHTHCFFVLLFFIPPPCIWPDALALCPEVDLLISGCASVGNRGRVARIQQNVKRELSDIVSPPP